MKGSAAPIRKVGRGKKPWLLDLRYIGGRREFYQTRGQAEAAREEKLIEVKNHGSAALSLTQDERLEFIRAKERISKTGATLAEVIDFFEKHHKAFTPTKLSDAISELHRLKLDSNKRERSANQFYYTLTAFHRQIGNKLVSEVARQDIEKWLLNPNWEASTKRTKLIDLQTFFRTAQRRGWTTHVPTDGIEKIELDDKPPGILSVEQCERLMHAAQEVQPQFCGFLALALFCGIRPDEVLNMEAGDVKPDFAEVRAEVSKTRKRRLVELSENAKAWIQEGLSLPPVNARNHLNAVRIKAGFDGFKKSMQGGHLKWVKVDGEPWPHDCLRHSFASYHLAMHGSADKTATQLGHRSTDMLFAHYRELVTRSDAERFWAIRPLVRLRPKHAQ